MNKKNDIRIKGESVEMKPNDIAEAIAFYENPRLWCTYTQ